MSGNLLNLPEDSHRNPSRSKIKSKSRPKVTPDKAKATPDKGKVTPDKGRASLRERSSLGTKAGSTLNSQFITKCFQHVYLQNIALSEQISRKKQQIKYLDYEQDRMRRLHAGIRKQQQNNANIVKYRPSNFTADAKKSLSLISSIEGSSFMSQKMLPFQPALSRQNQSEISASLLKLNQLKKYAQKQQAHNQPVS